MENKLEHYIPKIEDLFEGYEFEYQEYDYEKDEYIDNWIKGGFDSTGGLGHDLTHTFNEGRVRVPYLTKEQIVAEGWVYTGEVKGPWYNESTFEKKDFDSKKGIMDGYDTKYILKCYLKIPYVDIPLTIHQYTEGGFMGGVHVDGNIFVGNCCASINEFRKI
jgi:hypothetical protein